MTTPSRPSSQLRGLRLDRLLSFLAVIDTGGFTAAAEALFLSQPQVSRHVAELENALGCRLIDRTAKPPRLTSEGEAFSAHARTVATALQEAATEAEEYAHGLSGTVFVGMYPSVAYYLFPLVRESLQDKCPDIDLRLWEAMPHELMPALTGGTVDLIVQPGAQHDDPSVQSSPLWTEPLVAVVTPSDGLADPAGSPIPICDLCDRPVVTIGNPRSPIAPETEVARAFELAGIQPAVAMRTDLPQTLVAMVKSGLGPGVINLLAIRTVDTRDLIVRPIAGQGCERRVELAYSAAPERARSAVKAVVNEIAVIPPPDMDVLA